MEMCYAEGASWLAAELHTPTIIGGLAWGTLAASLTIAAGAVGGINWLKKGKGFTFKRTWSGIYWIC